MDLILTNAPKGLFEAKEVREIADVHAPQKGQVLGESSEDESQRFPEALRVIWELREATLWSLKGIERGPLGRRRH